MSLTIVTINLQSGAPDWKQRLPLMVAQLKDLAPDLVAVQEVSWADGETAGPAEQIAAGLGYPHLAPAPRDQRRRSREAVAIISRLPFEAQDWLDLGGQGRVAQRVTVQAGGQAVVVANAHLFWQPGDSSERLRQVEQLLHWLDGLPGRPPTVVCGDFNGTPETRAIRRMQQDYVSAYAAIHGREPAYTFPTPLRRSKRAMLLSVWDLLIYVRPGPVLRQALTGSLNSTLDYIFVDRRLHVADCRLALDQPAAGDPRLYPSDHYGLWAKID